MAKEENRTIISKIPLQETRLFYKRYDNYSNLNNLLMTEIEEERKKDPGGLPSTNPGCWRSMFKYKCEKELMKPIGMMLAAWTDHYLPKKILDANITYWTNVNEPGSSNMFHNHAMAGADLSGVYYIQGDKTGLIRFATHEQMYKLIPAHLPYSDWIAHLPSDGDILVFPSYLQHDVATNPHPSRQRISIAFNAVIKEKEKENVIPFKREEENENGN